jgi:hypothetical protein
MHVGHFIGVMAIGACFVTASGIAVKAMPVEHEVYDTVVPNPNGKIIALREACTGRYPLTVEKVDDRYGEKKDDPDFSIVSVKPKGSAIIVTCRVLGQYENIWNNGDQIVILNGSAV